MSTARQINCPDLAVFDLDPAEGVAFSQVLEVALIIRDLLAGFGLQAYPKTSGAGGLHLFVPLLPVYPFPTVTLFTRSIAEKAAASHPEIATVERKVEKRKGKVYIDYLQNGCGKTMAFQYSLRPLPGAPVSAPLTWKEVEQMNVQPASIDIRSIFDRLQEFGDLFRDLLISPQSLKLPVKEA